MATPAPKGPCRFFRSKEGCKHRNCKFTHDLRPIPGTGTQFRSYRQNASSSSTATSSRIRLGGVPRNNCEFYWNTGQCNRGFDCTFKHQKNSKPQPGGTNAADGEEEPEDAANTALEFFTMDNLTQMAGVRLHRTQEGTPENAHNSIKQYLQERSLTKPDDMRNLISILASVNRRNHSWVCAIPPFTLDGC